MRQEQTWRAMAAVALLGLSGPMAVRAADPTPPAAAAATTFLLGQEPAVPLPGKSPADLLSRWPAFRHADLDASGFNAVSMPLHVRDPDHVGPTDDEAKAFAFLLSDDLDWSPACYCERHANFVFSRSDPAQIAALTPDGEYDPAAVATLVQQWQATAAVGGTITRSAKGYSGELVLCGPDGHVTHRRSFDAPRPYWELLGDFSADALATLGPPPTPALVKLLHAPRCHDMASVAALGAASAFEAQSPQGLDALAAIVDRSPEFAEVRAWVANQAGWAGLATTDRDHQMALALDVRPLPAPMMSMAARHLPPDLAAKVPGWIAAATVLAGPDHPAVLLQRLAQAPANRPIDPDLRAAALASSAKYPNAYWLLDNTARAVANNNTTCDYDLASGLFLTAFADHLMTGPGTKVETAQPFVMLAGQIGRPLDGAVVALSRGAGLTSYLMLYEGTLLDAGQYELATAVYDAVSTQAPQTSGRDGAIAYAALAAAFTGHADTLAAMLDRDRSLLEKDQCLPLVQALADHAAGRPVNIDDLDASYVKLRRRWQGWPYLVALAELDQSAGTERFRPAVEQLAEATPNVRLAWEVLDGYDRRRPRPQMAQDLPRAAVAVP